MIDQVDSRRGTIFTSQSSAVEALMPIDEFCRKAQTHCQWQPQWAKVCGHSPGFLRVEATCPELTVRTGILELISRTFFFFLFSCLLSPLAPRLFFLISGFFCDPNTALGGRSGPPDISRSDLRNPLRRFLLSLSSASSPLPQNATRVLFYFTM